MNETVNTNIMDVFKEVIEETKDLMDDEYIEEENIENDEEDYNSNLENKDCNIEKGSIFINRKDIQKSEWRDSCIISYSPMPEKKKELMSKLSNYCRGRLYFGMHCYNCPAFDSYLCISSNFWRETSIPKLRHYVNCVVDKKELKKDDTFNPTVSIKNVFLPDMYTLNLLPYSLKRETFWINPRAEFSNGSLDYTYAPYYFDKGKVCKSEEPNEVYMIRPVVYFIGSGLEIGDTFTVNNRYKFEIISENNAILISTSGVLSKFYDKDGVINEKILKWFTEKIKDRPIRID